MPRDPAARPKRSRNPIDAAREAFSELIGESPRQTPCSPADSSAVDPKRKAEPINDRHQRETV